ncbi:MAG: dihydrolipoyl dehydrogenase [Candidatus Omnitrophota bacterium]
MKHYDLAIIGSGPGGYVAGLYAARRGLTVCVIEKDLVGGTCLNRGCIPTKAMLHSASLFSRIKEAAGHGIKTSPPSVDFPVVFKRKEEIVLKLRTGIETLFRANKIDLIKGNAKFCAPRRIVAGKEEIEASSSIIATGSRAVVPPGIYVDETIILTSDGILGMKELPGSILVIGGGVIGCEFATLFNAFGVTVTIVEALDRILIGQSRETSRKMELLFKKRGIAVHTSSKAEAVVRKDGGVETTLSNGRRIVSDKLLMAIGRMPYIEGLEEASAGIRTERGRIEVDSFLRTGAKNIYAIGDCIPGPLLAHRASYDGILACDNIMGAGRRADYSHIPNCVYTDPEIASVGLTEDDAGKTVRDARTVKFPYLASGKAFLMDRTGGFIKITGDPSGKLLGVEIFGEGACDLIGEASLAVHAGLSVKDLAGTVHGHPTLSEIYQEAAHIFCGTAIHSI